MARQSPDESDNVNVENNPKSGVVKDHKVGLCKREYGCTYDQG